jgi:hypothetical protein
MEATTETPKFVLCVDNDYYKVALALWKVYQVIPDSSAERLGMIRIIDESGEDYLFSTKLFVPIELPQIAVDAMLAVKS